MIYFTADHHFGHANIIRHCEREFTSVEEMDAVLTENWNRAVKPTDTVYILGDLFFRNAVLADDYLQRLNGKKHLIVGNHDKNWMKKTDLPRFFESVERFAEISDGSHKITFCHYPMMTWKDASKGGYMIHGHIHNDTRAMYFPLYRTMPNLLNAGVDINNFHPVDFNTLLKNNIAFKEQSLKQIDLNPTLTEKEVVDEIVDGIGGLVGNISEMAEQALKSYMPIAEDIIAGRITGENNIGYQLDFMLDFCWDDKVLTLYKKVLRSIKDKHPDLVVSYIESYKNLWENEEPEQDEE